MLESEYTIFDSKKAFFIAASLSNIALIEIEFEEWIMVTTMRLIRYKC